MGEIYKLAKKVGRKYKTFKGKNKQEIAYVKKVGSFIGKRSKIASSNLRREYKIPKKTVLRKVTVKDLFGE